MKFYITDAFTNELFGGNPAGIVLLSQNQDFPDEDLMIKTAAELRYSETVFIKPLEDNVFQLRYFTPTDEVDLCGHATIAAFHTLSEKGFINPATSCIAKTAAGDLNIGFTGDNILMDMASPKLITTITSRDELKQLYNVLGIELEHIAHKDLNGNTTILYPQIISTGLPDILVPVSSQEILSSITPDFEAMTSLSIDYDVVGIHAFAPNLENSNSSTTAYCRNFAPLYDIDEEAATGTANGALTYYLYSNSLISGNFDCSFIQGIELDRPSTINSKIITSSPGSIHIKVGGSAVILAEGNININ